MKTPNNKKTPKTKFVIINQLDRSVYQTKNCKKFEIVLEVVKRWKSYPVFWTGTRKDEYTVKIDHEYDKRGHDRVVDCELKIVEPNKDHRKMVFEDLQELRVCKRTGAVVWPLKCSETPANPLLGQKEEVKAKIIYHMIPEDIGEVYDYEVEGLKRFEF